MRILLSPDGTADGTFNCTNNFIPAGDTPSRRAGLLPGADEVVDVEPRAPRAPREPREEQ